MRLADVLALHTGPARVADLVHKLGLADEAVVDDKDDKGRLTRFVVGCDRALAVLDLDADTWAVTGTAFPWSTVAVSAFAATTKAVTLMDQTVSVRLTFAEPALTLQASGEWTSQRVAAIVDLWKIALEHVEQQHSGVG